METSLKNIGISLGWNCHSAGYGVLNGIRDTKANGYTTCPFDMMISNYPGICQCIKDDFNFLFDEKYLDLRVVVSDKEWVIYNTKYNFGFNHESPGHADLYITENWPLGINHFVLNNYENFKKLYSRRTENLKNYLSDPNNFITFIITSWNKTDEDMKDLDDILKEKYPNLKYRYLILNDPNGIEYFKKHLRDMGFTENDEELKRLL
jgi:hypothetical protein